MQREPSQNHLVYSAHKDWGFLLVMGLVLLVVCIEPAFAQALPWEGPLAKIQKSLSGPVAMSISVIGIMVAGASLIFGAELDAFVRKLIMLALVISVMIAANSLVTTLF